MALLNQFHARVKAKAKDNSLAPVLIVALGDSVTQGCMEEGRMDFDAVYHHQLKRLLERRYPATTFSVVNAGVGGESASGGLARLARDVIRHQPDLVIVGYGLNDACGGLGNLTAFRDVLAGLLRRIRCETEADIVLLTPNRMAAHDNDLVPARWKPIIGHFVETQRGGALNAYVQAIREVGAGIGVVLADVRAAWENLERQGTDTTPLLCNGINHPNAEMHEATARIIMKEIETYEK